MAMRARTRPLLARSDTDIVIEGFPRSGNTFAVVAFRMAQPTPVRIARHLHAPAQALWGVRQSVPTLVLIREPSEAVLSLVIREPHLSLGQGLRQYIRFYRTLTPQRRRFVVAPFSEVISAFGSIVDRVNEMFGAGFERFEHTPENVERAFSIIDEMDRVDTGRADVTEATVARPSRDRDPAKSDLGEDLLRPELAGLLTRADRLYAEFVS